MSPYWQALAAAAVVFALLWLVPAPEGCGCAERKRRLASLGREVFGA